MIVAHLRAELGHFSPEGLYFVFDAAKTCVKLLSRGFERRDAAFETVVGVRTHERVPNSSLIDHSRTVRSWRLQHCCLSAQSRCMACRERSTSSSGEYLAADVNFHLLD